MVTSIIVPVYKNNMLTMKLVNDITPELVSTDSELIIVDNDSNIELREFCRNREHIIYVDAGSNLGFGKANNLGVTRISPDCDKLIFMSNDVLIEGNFLETAKDNILNNAIYGARLIKFETGWNKFKEISEPVPYIEGWFLCMTTNDYHKLGGWDERYWLDYEDLDICYNALKHNFHLHADVLPLRHLGGQTAAILSEGRLQHTLTSQQRFCEKWHLNI